MNRLGGLDLARYLALLGMVVVNFDVVMVDPLLSNTKGTADFLQGKAAALFVILAGLGFGLASNHKPWSQTIGITSKRFMFLLALGLINCAVFQADIIHFYAFYFLFAMLLLPLSSRLLVLIIAGILVDAVLMIMVFDYDLGWDWANYHYQDFWTLTGFFRNLFFNGWHPVIPWLAFMVFGMLISRTNLAARAVQIKLLLLGGLVYLLTQWFSAELVKGVANTDPELVQLLTTKPIPPMPLYMVSAAGFACAVIGLCLLMEGLLRKLQILKWVTAAGKQTLTWYIAHIFLGMGFLEITNRIANQTHQQALMAAATFCLLLTVVAYFWSTYFKRGPLEALMRKLTG